ncbi:AzlC family ABC transporter permease [Devriesea agamarum]|uniref:AzlC family ABC transporter permease n=1 Tax=Devriesea agamarum TaxID=472569 RepID=UPI001E5E18FD|nr:AzlC family ABC transporter permease [Devriesea agamarum]
MSTPAPPPDPAAASMPPQPACAQPDCAPQPEPLAQPEPVPTPEPETALRPEPAPGPEPTTTLNTAGHVRAARRQGFTIGVATGLYGISFGALAVTSGLTLTQTMAMSLILFSGGSQFAFIGVISAGGAFLSAGLAALLLGVRNTLYAMALTRFLNLRGLTKLLGALFTIDESVATSAAQTDPTASRAGFWSAGLWVYVWWNLMTLVGALLGNLLGEPRAYGLDAAAAAAFLGLLWPRLKNKDTIALAGAAAFIALITTPMLPAGIPILCAALVGVVWVWRTPRTSDQAETREVSA